ASELKPPAPLVAKWCSRQQLACSPRPVSNFTKETSMDCSVSIPSFTAIAHSGQTHDLILAAIAVVALGSLLAPLVRPLSRIVIRVLPKLGLRLWNILLDRLITFVIILILTIMGSIAWLAELAEALALILKH